MCLFDMQHKVSDMHYLRRLMCLFDMQFQTTIPKRIIYTYRPYALLMHALFR
jgi:lipopolysaccharide assembly outer membrane protein LptD (OstA)